MSKQDDRARPSDRDPDAAASPEHALGPWHEVAFATVTDPDAGRLLSDPAWLAWLEPFLGRASGIADAARRLGRPLEATRYRVRRMERAGLIEVVGQRERAGRPVRLYRSVADGFVVPFEATPYVDVEERLAEVVADDVRAFARSAAQAMRDSGLEARRVYRGPDGAVHQEAAADEAALAAAAEADPIESLGVRARLPRSVARGILQELIRLAKRFERLEAEPPEDAHGPTRSYRLMLMLAPEPDDPPD